MQGSSQTAPVHPLAWSNIPKGVRSCYHPYQPDCALSTTVYIHIRALPLFLRAGIQSPELRAPHKRRGQRRAPPRDASQPRHVLAWLAHGVMAADGARKADADETTSMRMAAQLLSDQRAWIHALLRRGRTGTREDAGDGGREAEGGCHHAALETGPPLGDGQRQRGLTDNAYLLHISRMISIIVYPPERKPRPISANRSEIDSAFALELRRHYLVPPLEAGPQSG